MEKIIEQIPSNQEEGELDIETTELQVEDLDFWTLSFLREHIDMPERIDFDPGLELENIKKAVAESPKEEQSNQRTLLMASFKKRLKILRENMAQAQLELEHFIRGNQQVDRKELLLTTREIAHRNKVSDQVEYLYKAIDLYFQAHSNIVDTVKSYEARYSDNWQNKLFEDLFGQPPRGQIEIETMPINIYIKIGSVEDFVTASGFSEDVARNAGGASLQIEFPKVKTLSAKVLIENTSFTYPIDSEERIKPHEEEHSIHKNIYPRSAFIKGEQDWLRDAGRNKEIELPLFNTVMHKSVTNVLLGSWLYGAKTEILAYMKNGRSISLIKQMLTDEHGLYNYIDNAEIHQNWFLGHLITAGIKVQGLDNHQLTDEEIKIIYSGALEEAWHKRYLPMLEKAFQALEKILSNYGPDKYPEIMRLLAQEPINKWPRLAKILS
ncbi:MAG: hypothetical protein Q7S43_01200 [bacterium]|nr:hypothetical protein [bacterium]